VRRRAGGSRLPRYSYWRNTTSTGLLSDGTFAEPESDHLAAACALVRYHPKQTVVSCTRPFREGDLWAQSQVQTTGAHPTHTALNPHMSSKAVASCDEDPGREHLGDRFRDLRNASSPLTSAPSNVDVNRLDDEGYRARNGPAAAWVPVVALALCGDEQFSRGRTGLPQVRRTDPVLFLVQSMPGRGVATVLAACAG
jgi:hypothetical protein